MRAISTPGGGVIFIADGLEHKCNKKTSENAINITGKKRLSLFDRLRKQERADRSKVA